MLRSILYFLLITTVISLDNEAEQVHLSLDGLFLIPLNNILFVYMQNLSESLNTVVTWSTFEPTDSVVKFGISEKELDSRIKGVQNKFVDPGKRIHTQYIHRTTLVGLVPNTKYCKCPNT